MNDISPRYYGHLLVRADEWHTGYVIPVDRMDRYLRGRDASVVAEALRTASEALSQVSIMEALDRDVDLASHMTPGMRAILPLVKQAVEAWLRENADDIERGAQS